MSNQCLLCGVILSLSYMQINASDQYERMINDSIRVHNQTDKRLYVLIYNIGKEAVPCDDLQRGKALPQVVNWFDSIVLTRPERHKYLRFFWEKQKVVIALFPSLLGYPMTPRGVECFPTIAISGLRRNNKRHFYITPELLVSAQFGRLTPKDFPCNGELDRACYCRLMASIEQASLQS